MITPVSRLTPVLRFARVALALLVAASAAEAGGARGETMPWRNDTRALVIDAYELNLIDWEAMTSDRRIAGFISKASDGLPEVFDCSGAHKGDSTNHCRTMWRKYAVSRELFQTRRLVARAKGLLWGAYHLGRPGNPVEQANHFLDYAQPRADEAMVLDIEGLDPAQFMSPEDAGLFAAHIKARTGRYPVLYTNHATARFIAENRARYPILSRLPLWYARYRPSTGEAFPLGNWDRYWLWQFSADANCGRRRCPYRVPGTLSDIDVNVAPADRKALSAAWAKGELVPEKPLPPRPAPPPLLLMVSARAAVGSGAGLAMDMTVTGALPPPVLEAADVSRH
ncbi:hypothetical protein BTR14_21490 [Rhizobium rhizosphaerae]|uniref:Lysozyme n=1 Tax=Xaviernesmea rhizosphaerae TaxID=1672749 RepID=A0ABX3P838_9HYPH|nr:hypothetical protein BTR14_21490 [Xaviernesmea rhizosphaerae]